MYIIYLWPYMSLQGKYNSKITREKKSVDILLPEQVRRFHSHHILEHPRQDRVGGTPCCGKSILCLEWHGGSFSYFLAMYSPLFSLCSCHLCFTVFHFKSHNQRPHLSMYSIRSTSELSVSNEILPFLIRDDRVLFQFN